MVDPYAIVRRLTGHEIISPKDARLLTEAVDGLIDEIGSKDARIAELEAENERLTKERDNAQQLADINYENICTQHRQIEELTRRAEALSRTGAVKVGYANSTAPGNPFVTPAPEGQQEPVAWGEFYGGKIVAVSLHKSHHYTVPLYTRPSEQAVTEAMVEAAANSIANIWCTGDLKAIVRAALKAAMEAGR